MLRFLLSLVALSVAYASSNITAQLTFYGAKDNCPPGGEIAYPKIHKQAGGLGTYADPITFAGAIKAIPKYAIVYVPKYSKYFIQEDQCEECEKDWSKSSTYHLDLWMGPLTAESAIIPCENQLSDDKATSTVMLNPPNNLKVDTTAFFDPKRSANNGCIVKAESCTDVGTKCGNECEIPSSASCSSLASLFDLSTDRFKALNVNTKYNVDCSKTVPSGKTVCMGGTCGDF